MTEFDLKEIEEMSSYQLTQFTWQSHISKLLKEIRLLRAAFTDSMLDTDAIAVAKRVAF